jgi:hypothetical protein
VDVSTYRRSLDNAMRSLAGLVRLALGAGVPRTRDQKIEAAYLLTGGVRAARLDTHRIAANYLQHRGVDVSGFPARPQEYRFRSVIDTLDRVIDPAADASSPQVAVKVAEDLTRALRRHAEEPARALVRQAAAVTGGSWARVLTGPTSCSFCVMMASRGPVYESNENAVRSGPGKTMFEGTEVAAVHDGCDCVTAFVPKGSKTWEGRAQWLALKKAWDECGPDGEHRADDDARPDRLVFRSWWEHTVRDGKGHQYIAPSVAAAAPTVAADVGGRSMYDWEDERIPAAVRRHIMDGEPGEGGGHRHNSTAPNTTLFPARWDDYAAVSAISTTLDNFYTTSDDHPNLFNPDFVNLYAIVDRVRMLVRLNKPDGSIITGHPLDGEGVYRTEKHDGTRKKQLPLGRVRNVPLPS